MLDLINNNTWIYFVKNPSSRIHIREISRRIKISPPSVLNQTKKLIKKGLLVSEKQGKNVVISSNYENELFIEKKKWTNLFLLLDSGIVDKLNCINNTVILFGSYSKGEDTERSDIDIAIDKKPNINLEEYEDKLERKIQFHIIERKMQDNLKENIRQGILLGGLTI